MIVRFLKAGLPVLVLLKGFVLLNILLFPLTLLLTLFIGIMAGAAPNADPVQAFAMVILMIYVMPAGIFAGHLVVAKIVDTILFLVPPLEARSSWVGLVSGSVLFVILGNIFVDNLYQWSRGDFTLSVMALLFDLVGLAAVAGTGMIPIGWIDRRIRPKSAAAGPSAAES